MKCFGGTGGVTSNEQLDFGGDPEQDRIQEFSDKMFTTAEGVIVRI